MMQSMRGLFGEKTMTLKNRANPTVERDSQQAALVGALRATRSGCPSLPRWAAYKA